MRRTFIFAAVSLVLVGLLTYGGTQASAQSPAPMPNPIESLVTKLAQRFNLNQADIQSVFDEAHTERKAYMQARLEERLTLAVKDGKITEAQKQAILAKFAELKIQRQVNKDDLKNWATQNGLDENVLRGLIHPFGRMHRGWGWK